MIRDASPDTRIVMFATEGGRQDEAVAAGADAWFSKGRSFPEVLDKVLELTAD